MFAEERADHWSGGGGILLVGASSAESSSVGVPQARQNRCASNNSIPQFLHVSAINLDTVFDFYFLVSSFRFAVLRVS